MTSLLTSSFLITGFKNFNNKINFKPDPFRINFNKNRVEELYKKLNSVEWPLISFQTNWESGTNDEILKDLVNYWRNDYDWYKVQKELNKLDHFKIKIDGEKIHFVWYRNKKNDNKFPILLLHGWPSSFLELKSVSPNILKGNSKNSGFNVIVPSLPGFTFSDPPMKPGINIGKIGERFHLMMKSLGFKKYGVHGGDWGSSIAVEMSKKYPDSVVGLHYTSASTKKISSDKDDLKEKQFINRYNEFQTSGRSYFDIQATKPQTLAYAHQDSPVGFLAWVLEKYWSWSDHSGNLWDIISKEDLLTNVMIYWLNKSVLSSSRIYFETKKMTSIDWSSEDIIIPTGYSRFPNDFLSPPISLVRSDLKSRLTYFNELDVGGHFPAMEQPDLFSNEIINFFSSL